MFLILLYMRRDLGARQFVSMPQTHAQMGEHACKLYVQLDACSLFGQREIGQQWTMAISTKMSESGDMRCEMYMATIFFFNDIIAQWRGRRDDSHAALAVN